MLRKVKSMRLRAHFIALGAITAVSALFIIVGGGACNKQEQEPSANRNVGDGRYKDWSTYSYQNIRILYAPTSAYDTIPAEMISGHIQSYVTLDDLPSSLRESDTITVYFRSTNGLVDSTRAELSTKRIRSLAPLSGLADGKSHADSLRIWYEVTNRSPKNLADMAQADAYLLRKVSEILVIPPITDTITIYYYTGYGQGRELTGREYPYADSNAIHFWLPSFYGPTLMQYLLPRWAPDPPRNKFLRHGLISMFDLSGQRYHETTIGYLNKETFIPLDSLAKDTLTDSNLERYQSGEAASFCAFIIGQYGPKALKELYISNQPFDAGVRQVLLSSVDTLQALWLDYVRQNVPKDSLRN